MTARTFSLEEAGAQICGDSMKNPKRWVRDKIHAGIFRGTKVGRHVRMTERQIQDAIAALEIGTAQPEPQNTRRMGVTAASLRRRTA